MMTAVLLLLGVFSAQILWSAPSPLLPEMMNDLAINMTQGGLALSVIMLIYSAASFCMDAVCERVKAAKLFLVSLLLMGAGQLLFFGIQNFGTLMSARVLIGIGMGVLSPVYAMLIMENYTERQRPVLNTIFSGLPYFGTLLLLYTIVPLYRLFHESWRITQGILGAAVLLLAVVYALLMKQIKSPPTGKTEKGTALIGKAARMREVRLLTVADFCDLWGYAFLSSFLPTFLRQEYGMSMERASAIAVLFPAAGLIGCAAGGYLMIRIGLRKPFTWPMHLMIFAGTLLLVTGKGPLMYLGILLAGFGNAAWAPALYTMPMEMKGVGARMAGAIFCFVYGIGYIGGFISPILGGRIGDAYGLKPAFILNSFAALTAAIVTFRMKETGERRKRENHHKH